MAFRLSTNDEILHAFDPLHHAHTTIDVTHRVAHDGFMHHASGKVTGMVADNVDDFLITTPAGVYPHLQRVNFDFGDGDIDIQTYHSSTTSAPGTTLANLNTNRNSSKTAGAVLSFGPTVTGIGTLMHTAWAPPTATGNGQSAAGISDIENGEEWILAPSSKYIIRVTNGSGSEIEYRYEFLWYELDFAVP